MKTDMSEYELLEADRERQQRLASVGELTGRVVHDINNVLNSLLIGAYLLEACASDEASVRDHAQRLARTINSGSAKLAPLREFVRQIAEQEAEQPPVDLAHAVMETLKTAAPLWECREPAYRVAVERHLGIGALVHGSSSDLRAALLNLVHNALDAMPKGGTLFITTAARDDWAIVEVRDTGNGLTKEEAERAFEPRFTSDADWRKGIGLAEAEGIVSRHRGVAEIESEPGRGTVIRLRFPLARAQ